VLTSANIGSNLPTGSVLQVVSTTKTDVFSTSSTSFVDITGLSVSITPTSVSNKILVMVNASISKGTGGDVVVQLLRDSTVIGSSTGVTNNGFAQASVSYANAVFSGVAIYLDSPSSTSAITYKVQIKGDTATSYVNRRGQDANWGGASSITVMEIKG
jgi:hypothetical protein